MADPETPSTPPTSKSPGGDAADLAEAALKAAQQAVSKLSAAAGQAPEGKAVPFEPQNLQKLEAPASPKGIDLLSDVNLNVKIELGRTRMLVEDVLKLSDGAVVELDKLAGDPVDVYVNDRHIARGEVLVLNDNFCVRINEILQQIGDADQPGKAAG